MAPPPQLSTWLNQHYPSPRVDAEWLDACYAWVVDEHQLDPASQMPAIINHVEAQLLQSDLCDSMSHGTGIPLPLLTAIEGTLRGPVLVEITAMTEVGASALSLDQVRVARAERLAAGADAEEGNEADLEVDGEGPVPNYPRSMLRFQLSDGASTLSAFEYRSLPELRLGVTPLGYKLVLKDVLVRRGMAFLEPTCVTFKGHQTEDREAQQEADFARGLRERLGRPEPDPPAPAAQAAPEPQPNPPPVQQIRSPLREISPPPSPTLAVEMHQHSDDESQPRRRRVPAPAPPAASSASSATLSISPYFSSSSGGPAPRRGDMGLALSPRRTDTIEIDSTDDEENIPVMKRPIAGRKSLSKRPALPPSPPREDPSSDDYGMDESMDDGFLAELQKLEENNEMQPQAGPSRRHMNDDADVITIDDEEDDMEDKENIPAPQRHVRRRVFGEVIEIDSD
ncbi:hypothetical protein FB45DRAFT_1050260 [Roridomyces roridus]|uniref:RecQ-mediated genome instability protein 1 n=1 Tax=Roridomyces roridus TaxID=1738132 RepID=A0AAD7G105_9AGAR|nr:hypothetical protein FB45DRAFT_1050260 [Roridomyces roridus]